MRRRNFLTKILLTLACEFALALGMVGLEDVTNTKAETAEHTHKACGQVTCAHTTHLDGITYTPFSSKGFSETAFYDTVNEVESYYLDEDKKIDGLCVANGKTLNLCLNGKTLTVSAYIGVGGKLNVCDCGLNGAIHTREYRLTDGGELNVYGGAHVGKEYLFDDSRGESSTVNVYDGTLKAEKAIFNCKNVANVYGGGYKGKAFEGTGFLTVKGAPTFDTPFALTQYGKNSEGKYYLDFSEFTGNATFTYAGTALVKGERLLLGKAENLTYESTSSSIEFAYKSENGWGFINAKDESEKDVVVLGHISHGYDNDCAEICNNERCSERRIAPHSYTSDCDTACDVEGCTGTREGNGQHTYGAWGDWSYNGDGSHTKIASCVCGKNISVSAPKQTGVEHAGLQQEALALGAELALNVEKDESKIAEGDKTSIRTQVTTEKLFFVDVTITNVTKNEAVATTTAVIELMIEFDSADKTNVIVYRNHAGKIRKFAQLATRPTTDFLDGTFFMDGEKGCIYVYSKQFSTYGVGYDDKKIIAEMPPIVDEDIPDENGKDGIDYAGILTMSMRLFIIALVITLVMMIASVISFVSKNGDG